MLVAFGAPGGYEEGDTLSPQNLDLATEGFIQRVERTQ